MNADQLIFIENLLRRVFQTTDKLEDEVTTSSDIKDMLIKHGFYIEVENVNEMMEKIGFVGKTIPNEADKIWLVLQSHSF